jgi:two-component system sensor histidine kinase/response regulator
MNAILGLTELAMDSAATEHQRQLLGTVKSAAHNLLGIINDLLDFSKIEAGRMALDLAPFGLRAAVGDTLRAIAGRAHRKGLELVCQVRSDVPDALIGDASRLRQVLLNLVGNAIKFTARGEVVVEVATVAEAVACDTVQLRFEVRDTGIGIAREKQAAIFRAFEQEDSSTTRQ